MPAPNAIRFNQNDRTLTFQVEGRATMTHSLPFRRQGERALEHGTTHLRVDLRNCTYMDSTFLGTLLTLKKAVDRIGAHMTLVAPSTPCVKILHQMGLTDVLPAQSEDVDPQVSWTELPCGINDPGFQRTVVQAHEELAALPGPAGEEFKSVVRCLESSPPAKPASSSRPTE